MRPGELVLIAKAFAEALDSGKRPENPPLATTPGSCPKTQIKDKTGMSFYKTNMLHAVTDLGEFIAGGTIIKFELVRGTSTGFE